MDTNVICFNFDRSLTKFSNNVFFLLVLLFLKLSFLHWNLDEVLQSTQFISVQPTD